MKKILFAVGGHDSGSPFEQGRAAAGMALAQAGQLPPALALVTGRGRAQAGEVLRGIRDALGDCPLLGFVSDPDPASSSPGGVRVILVASPHLRAKVGVGVEAGGGVEEEVRNAFRESFIPASVPDLPENAQERNLYHWYLYRRPSLAIATVFSPAGEPSAHERRVASFLRRRLHGRVPLLLLSLPSGEGAPVLLADGRVVRSGVVLTMVKTDLKFTLERFHSFEPVGVKLFVTRAEGDRILEFNGCPAIEAYCEALSLDREAVLADGDALRTFALFPLAHRTNDGRFHLLRPAGVGADGSLRFSGLVESDRVLYPMKAVPASDFWHTSRGKESPLAEQQQLAAALVIRDTSLRDIPKILPIRDGDSRLLKPVEISAGTELKSYLSPLDTEGEAGHLLLAFARELDPFAVAAAENERLLTQVVQLKDLHQKIFDSIGYGIAVVDASRKILFCNNTHRVLLGNSAAPLEGCACPWSGDRTAVCGTCACEEAIAEGAPVNREIVRLENGKSRWYRLDTFPLHDASGKLTAAVEVMRDITAFKDLRFSLESEQRKMEAIIRGMGETLYIVNGRYELEFLHQGAFLTSPETGGGTRGRTCHEAMFRRNLPCSWCRMPETMMSGRVERGVATATDEAGEGRSYQITFSPWGTGHGDQGSVVCLLVDITAQQRLEKQMVLSEKLNSLSILSAGMAHELNNPLGAINFNLEILKRREKDAEYREVLESIRKDVLRINRIVGNLLSFSRSGAPSSGWIALPEVIDTALELFQVVIERRRIEVHRSYAEALQPVWGNAQDLQQVFINFIANAVDAMPAGGMIDIAVGPDGADAGEEVTLRVAVVYDSAAELTLLRGLTDVPGWEVQFYRGDGEAIDSFRRNSAAPPDVLLLDFTGEKYDQADFFVTMAREYAPDLRVIAISGSDGRADNLLSASGVNAVLPRPPSPGEVLRRVNELMAGVRSRRRVRAAVVVRFSDTGIGIPSDVQARIFDPFFTTKETKGTGLGLSVVHKILQDHGASVGVSSTSGQGTRFTVKFPQGQGDGTGIPFLLRSENGFTGGG